MDYEAIKEIFSIFRLVLQFNSAPIPNCIGAMNSGEFAFKTLLSRRKIQFRHIYDKFTLSVIFMGRIFFTYAMAISRFGFNPVPAKSCGDFYALN